MEHLKKYPQTRVCGFLLCSLFITLFHDTLSTREFSDLLEFGCPINPLQVLYLYNPVLVKYLLATGKLDVQEIIFDYCKSKPEPGKSEKYVEVLRILLEASRGKLEFFSREGMRVRELLARNNFTRGVYYEIVNERRGGITDPGI